MRGFIIFVSGTLVGLAVQFAFAQIQDNSSGSGILELNHVGIAVPDLSDAVSYYEDTLGFPEAFRVENAEGEAVLVYMQVSATTFVELQPANENRPAGLNHFGLQVEGMDQVRDMFIERGAEVTEIRSGSTKAILANVTELNGHRIELSEYPSDSLQGQFLGL
jgi:catechol 2,3-dioxygenase-like lactoylglutathione lyase family enzyme